MPEVIFDGTRGKIRVTYTETTNQASNSSTVKLTKVEMQTNGYAGLNFVPHGLISVNETIAYEFHGSPVCTPGRISEWYTMTTEEKTFTIPHNDDGSGSFRLSVAPVPGGTYGSFIFLALNTSYAANIFITTATVTEPLTYISKQPPTVSLALQTVNENATVAGWGIALQGYSKLKATITATPDPALTIASYRIDFGSGDIATARVATSQIVNDNGTKTVYASATDNAGQSGNASKSVTVYPYAIPSLNNISCERCDQFGNPTSGGTYLKVKATAEYSTANGHNSATITVRWRDKSEDTWSAATTLTSGIPAVIGSGQLLAIRSYDVEFNISDLLNAGLPVNQTAPTASVGFNLYPSTTGGAAFGKYAEREKEVDVPADWHYCIDGIDILSVIAPSWSRFRTYGVGDYVLYNTQLYRCLIQNASTIPAPGPYWETVTIATELKRLENLIGG